MLLNPNCTQCMCVQHIAYTCTCTCIQYMYMYNTGQIHVDVHVAYTCTCIQYTTHSSYVHV